MKIVNPLMSEKNFVDLNKGDVFMSDKKYYMKTYEIESPDGYFNNAVNLTTGAHAWFDKADLVVAVNCELTIK